MQDIRYPEIDQILLIMKETFYSITLVPKKYHLYTFLKIKDVKKESPYSTKIKYILLQLNPDEDKYYLLTPYPTLMPPLTKFSPESTRVIARNPNID